MKKVMAWVLVTVVLLTWGIVPGFAAQAPSLISQTAILMDMESGQILWEKNMDTEKFPASITKIVTVYLSVVKGNPQDMITVKPTAYIKDPQATHIALVENETVTLKDMQYAAMLMSANDACNVIAEHISGSQEKFVEEMNAFAKSVGAVNTHFTNSHGLPEDNHVTTAHDMALMLAKAMEEPMFREIFGTATYEMPANELKPKRPFATQVDMLKSNSANFYQGILGGKLGWTEEARHTMAVAAQRDGRTLLAVVMDSSSKMDKYKDTAALLDFGFDQFIPYTITPQMVPSHTASVMDGVNHTGDLDIFLSDSQQIYIHRAISPTDISFSIQQPNSLTQQQADNDAFPLKIVLPSEAEGLMYAQLPEIHLDKKLTPVMSQVEEISKKDQIVWLVQETGRVIGKSFFITFALLVGIMLLLLFRKYWILFKRYQRKRKQQKRKQAALARQRQSQMPQTATSPRGRPSQAPSSGTAPRKRPVQTPPTNPAPRNHPPVYSGQRPTLSVHPGGQSPVTPKTGKSSKGNRPPKG